MKPILNRQASFKYELLHSFTAGLALSGTAVKSIKVGKVSLTGAFCYIRNNEVFLHNVIIHKYDDSAYSNKDSNNPIKLLLTKKEINKISKAVLDKGITIIPTKIFTHNNLIKINIAIAKGKTIYDKRQSIKERDAQRCDGFNGGIVW